MKFSKSFQNFNSNVQNVASKMQIYCYKVRFSSCCYTVLLKNLIKAQIFEKYFPGRKWKLPISLDSRKSVFQKVWNPGIREILLETHNFVNYSILRRFILLSKSRCIQQSYDACLTFAAFIFTVKHPCWFFLLMIYS